jgi:hypothetical protein
VATDVACDFTTPSRVSDQRGISEVECLDYRSEVICLSIHVISCGNLTGPTVSAPINSNTAIPVFDEKKHLTVPSVRIQRPAVREGYDRAFAPVLIVDLGTIFRCDCAHNNFSSNLLVVITPVDSLGEEMSEDRLMLPGMPQIANAPALPAAPNVAPHKLSVRARTIRCQRPRV